MPKISLSRNHTLSPELIKQRLVVLGEKLQAKYQATTTWEGDSTMNVKGTGVGGKLTISASKVDVNLDLAWALSMMKGKIEETLTHELEKITRPETT